MSNPIQRPRDVILVDRQGTLFSPPGAEAIESLGRVPLAVNSGKAGALTQTAEGKAQVIHAAAPCTCGLITK